MTRTTSADRSCHSTVVGTTAPVAIEKFTLVAGLTFTLENERVTCVRCSVVRLLGTLPVVAAPLDVPLACPDWVAEVPLWPGVDCALDGKARD